MTQLDVTLNFPHLDDFEDVLSDLVEHQVASRITAQDPTLWGPDAEAESAIRLSWVESATASRRLVAEIAALKAELDAERIDRIVLAGMGGSSLAPEVICATADVELVTLDTTDAGQMRAALAALHRTAIVVSSKSGSTVETDSHRRVFEAAFRQAGIDPARRIIVVTDPGSPLHQASERAGYRKVFLADPHVGGRYSALTAFGLVPSGLAGADIGALLDAAQAATSGLAADSTDNLGLRLGAMLGLAHNSGANKVVFADGGSGIVAFSDWAEQLIAESTGKQLKGLLPVVVEDIEAPGYVDGGPDATLILIGATSAPKSVSGFSASVSGPLGAQFLLWEYATAVAGRIIGINPFDQPNVEEAKQQARQLLDAPANDAVGSFDVLDDEIRFSAANVDLAGATTVAAALTAFLRAAPSLGYVSIQAYLDRNNDTAAAGLRPLIAARTGLQTAFGWGPRFLHSTGQYHKGGHPNGVFLQITGAVTEDLAIPERPYTFATLQAAQAAGDAAVLAAKGRPVLRIHLAERDEGLARFLAIMGQVEQHDA